MGMALIELYKAKVKKEWKLAFLVSCVFGFVIHMWVFTGNLVNHDGLYNYYSTQHMVESGRWLLAPACSLSSYFNLPWLIGAISVFFIALTTVVVVDVFKMKNPVLIIITAGILVSSSTITEIFYYQFTADGYMIAMFLSALSVKLSLFEEKRIWRLLLAAACVCCSCAIYQSYVSFGMLLAIFYFMIEVFEGKRTLKECGVWIGKQVFVYAIGMAAYYIGWKVVLYFSHADATSYLGMDDVGSFGPRGIVRSITAIMWYFVRFFFEWDKDITEFRMSLQSFLNILFLIFAVGTILAAVCKSKVYRRKAQFVLGLVAACAIPFAAYFCLLVSTEVNYQLRMEQSMFICYIFVAVLAEKYLSSKLSTLLGVLLSVFVLYGGISANVAYYYMDKCVQQSYAKAVEIATQIHALDDGTIKKVYFSGDMALWSVEEYEDPTILGTIGKLRYRLDKNLLCGYRQSYLFFLNELGFELSYYRMNEDAEIPLMGKMPQEPVPGNWSFRFPGVSEEERAEIVLDEEYIARPYWPAADSVFVMGDTVVVKFSQETEEDLTRFDGLF